MVLVRVAPEQLELEVVRPEPPADARRNGRRSAESSQSGRLALSPDEAASVLGVSRDYFDEHVIGELRGRASRPTDPRCARRARALVGPERDTG